MNPEVEKVFNGYSEELRKPLLELRELVYDIASKIPEVGDLEESLKWGQPSYASKVGTPMRIDRFEENKIAILVHCQTTLIQDFRLMFPSLEFSKNRAIVLDPKEPLPKPELSFCIEKALTYHLK